MHPSVAEYWHIGAMTIRFGSSIEPTLVLVKRRAMPVFDEQSVARHVTREKPRSAFRSS
jgi:hypothetical protein